jgi:hypothetical protein
MKHTLKNKYAADGLNAHVQRMSCMPVADPRRKAAIDRVTERLTRGSRPLSDFEPFDFRSSAAMAAGTKFWASNLDKMVFEQLKAYSCNRAHDDLPDAASYAARFITGRRATMIAVDDHMTL